MKIFAGIVLITLASTASAYDIVYVRSPKGLIPEVKNPIDIEPGTDLMLLHENGEEEILVEGGDGAVVDPCVSFDGKWVYYAKVHNQRVINKQRFDAALSGSDIFKINVETREIVQLTFQEFTPNTSVGDWRSGEVSLGYGVYNLGACPVNGGRVVFTSSRNGLYPNNSFTFPNLQLFIMNEDGSNVQQIGYMNLSSVLHPFQLMDGRIAFSTQEGQGLRDVRNWGLWAIRPSGKHWEPLFSSFEKFLAQHWQTQLSDGRVAVISYYNQNNSGFGTLYAFPSQVPPDEPRFMSPNPLAITNPRLQVGYFDDGTPRYKTYSLPPWSLETLTPWATPFDINSSIYPQTGDYAGKVTQPSGAPNNEVLIVYSPGKAHKGDVDAGIYSMSGDGASTPFELVLIKNDPIYNEQQPRAVVPYIEIYGIEEPQEIDIIDTSTFEGYNEEILTHYASPFGAIGSSSLIRRNTSPGEPENNWVVQGADAGTYTNDDIHAIRIVSIEPSSHLSYGKDSFGTGLKYRKWDNTSQERLRILGEIPVRKNNLDGSILLDATGEPDTSFIVLLPADVPFLFQTLDKEGRVLNMSQTWHQVRPGEVRVNCGGCHAHAQLPLEFDVEKTIQSEYFGYNVGTSTPLLAENGSVTITLKKALNVEYLYHVKPLIEEKCSGCHTDLSTYEEVRDKVLPFRSRQSALINTLFGDANHVIQDYATRKIFIYWVDMGVPLDKANGTKNGYMQDETRPTVAISVEGNRLGVGLFDVYTGLDYESVKITSTTSIKDVPIGENLFPLMTYNGGYTWFLLDTKTITGKILVEVKDAAGNLTRKTYVIY